MRLRVRSWVLAVAVIWPALAHAQASLTLDELVTRALAEHPELQAARSGLEAATGRLLQAGLRPNPTLDLGGQKALGPDSNLTIGVTLPLDLNGRRAGRVGVAEAELAVERSRVADRERALTAEIRLKAGDLFAARRDLGVTDDLLRVNREALAIIGDRARLGRTPQLDEQLTRVEVNRLEATRAGLAGRAEVLALQLQTAAGLPPESALVVAGELTAATPGLDRESAVQRALERRPDVVASRAGIALARARVEKEQAEGRWDASVSVGYQRQDMGFSGLNGITDRGGTRPIQDVFHFFGAGVSVTVPVRNRNQGNVAAATAEAHAAERREALTVLVARQEVEAAYAQHAAARRAVDLYEEGVRRLARRNFDVVRETYELGRVTLLEVIAEQRRYLEVETGYTAVLKQAYDALVEIERATGGPGR